MKYSEAKQYLKEEMTVKVNSKYPIEQGEVGRTGKVRLSVADSRDWVVEDDNFRAYFDTNSPDHQDADIEILTNPDGSKWVHPDQQDQKLKVGDRVKVVRTAKSGCRADIGATGTLVTIAEVGLPTHGVEFDKPIPGGHACDGSIKDGFGYYLYPNELEKIEELKTATEVKIERQEKIFYNIADDLYTDGWYEKYYKEWEHKLINQQVAKYYYGMDFAQEPKPKKGKIMSAVETIKKLALKTTNPDEYELREAGIHNEDGALTSDGQEVLDSIIEEKFKEDLVKAAKVINEEKKSKK